MKNIAIILASGDGKRFGSSVPKQFLVINNKTILEHTIDKFENHQDIAEIIIVTNSNFIDTINRIASKYNKISKVIEGGNTRQQSSYNGVFAIEDEDANVLIHDGVRPFVTEKIITDCIKTLESYSAVCTVIDSTDTIFEVDNKGIINSIPQRTLLRRAQTPQCFRLDVIQKAHMLARNDVTCSVTDDCGLIIHYNLAEIKTIYGSENNIKITYPNDLEALKNI